MEQRDIQSKKRYVVSFFVACLIFLIIFGVSYSLSYFELQRVSYLQDSSAYQIFEDKLIADFFNEDNCNLSLFSKISQDLNFHGRIMDDLEKKFGKGDKDILFRKNFYSLVEVEHFDFVNEFNLRCNASFIPLLFFYSNEPSKVEDSEFVGGLISSISSKNSKVMVYSFDINLESDIVKRLKLKYNITESPTVIVGNNLIFHPRNSDNIEKFIN